MTNKNLNFHTALMPHTIGDNMSNSKSQILVQNVETFETIIYCV